MCGIAGFRGLRPEEQLLDRMISMIAHRGPDEFGTYVDRQFCLGVARLSIVDLSGGKQPIRDEASGVVIGLNGEIFNYPELRELLEQKGHRFRTKSDTEVVLRLYLQEGERFPELLNGQFAICIWDERKKKLLLARDRFGICPLFFHASRTGFYFASEIKSLLVHQEIPRSLNFRALDQLFTFWCPIAGNTFFEKIQEVAPGSIITVGQDFDVKVDSYWKWPFPQLQSRSSKNFSDACQQFREELLRAVQLRLRADVEVGSYLSGGIDSSALVALFSQARAGRVRTYSIGFEDNSYDESRFQNAVSDLYQTKHSHFECAVTDIEEEFERAVWHSESPIFRTAPVPMSHLSRRVRLEGGKVVLSGEGADEVLLGYDLFREVKVRRFWSRQPNSSVRPELLKRLYSYLPQFSNSRYASLAIQAFRGSLMSQSPFYSHLVRWQNNSANKVYFSKDLRGHLEGYDAIRELSASLPEEFFLVGDVDRAQYLELVLLLRGYLLSSQGDRMLMANSVEGRFPFLDHKFVEFVNSLPQNFKLRGLKDKYILRESMKSLLPAEVYRRPKFAYQAPELRAFFPSSGSESALVAEHLGSTELLNTGLFSQANVEKLIKKAKGTELSRLGARDGMAFVQMLSTQIFCKQFLGAEIQARADKAAVGFYVKTRLYGPGGEVA